MNRAVPAAPDAEAAWDPGVAEALHEILYGPGREGRDLDPEITRLERRHGQDVYAELIHLLSHLRFEPAEAKRCWQEIRAHRDTMSRCLGKAVDLRVALVSYFVEVNRRLKNPKVIELKLFEETQASAYRDELTGLCNYRCFREYLAREVHRAERYGRPVSLVMADIDDFKSYNDRNGHEAGNRALAIIARLLAGSLRKIDVAARYGGEEFALILPSTTKTGAQEVAERARRMIEERHFPRAERQPGGTLTVSLGVATYPADALETADLVRRADSALYAAKMRGKNQVHLYGQNRRSFRRIEAAIDGRFCVLATESHPLRTVNLSEGGLLFLAERNLDAGSLLDINLKLPGSDHEVTTTGRVIRVEQRDGGRFEAAIRIIDISARDQSLLADYLRSLSDETR